MHICNDQRKYLKGQLWLSLDDEMHFGKCIFICFTDFTSVVVFKICDDIAGISSKSSLLDLILTNSFTSKLFHLVY